MKLQSSLSRAVLTAIFLFACSGDSPTGPKPVDPATIVDRVVFGAAATDIRLGETRMLDVRAENAAGNIIAGQSIVLSSNDTLIVAINGSSIVARALGVANVTATAGTRSAVLSVSVTQVPVKSVSVQASRAEPWVGDTVAFTAVARDSGGNVLSGRTVDWTSSDSTILKFVRPGVALSKSVGSVKVTARSEQVDASLSLSVGAVPLVSVAAAATTTSPFVGDTITVTAQVTDARGNVVSGVPVLFSSSDTSVVRLLMSGLVFARAPGKATVTATVGNLAAVIELTVSPAPIAALTLSGPGTMYTGASAQFTVTAVDARNQILNGRNITWTTDNASLATVTSSGVVMAISPGTVTIAAEAEGKRAVHTLVVALVPIASVSLQASQSSAWVGDTVAFTAVARDASGNVLTGRSLELKSSDPAVLEFVGPAAAIARAPGTTTVTVTAGSVQASLQISVTLVPVATVAVTGPGSLFIGSTGQLSAIVVDIKGNTVNGRTINWSSANPGVGTVSSTGMVTALSTGTAIVNAEVEGKSASITIVVSVVPLKTLTAQVSAATLFTGDTVSFSASATDLNGAATTDRVVTWSSSNAAILEIVAGNRAVGKNVGSAWLIARAEGLADSVLVSVTLPPVASITLSRSTLELYVNDSTSVVASGFDARGLAVTGRTITWSSANTAVAQVTPNGVIIPIGRGTTRITAQMEAVSAYLTITVRRDPLILLHGFGSSGAVWNASVAKLVAEGWRSADIVAWTYTSTQSNKTTGEQLKVLIDSVLSATGARRVDVVTHSMGALPARYFLKNLGGQAVVDAFVSLAGPNHGTQSAQLCSVDPCVEMRVGSQFLSDLNVGDETPGSVRYATWWSACDGTIIPATSTPLTGAVNTETGCITHSQFATDDAVYTGVRNFIDP